MFMAGTNLAYFDPLRGGTGGECGRSGPLAGGEGCAGAGGGCQKLTAIDAIHGYAPRGYLLFSNLDKDKRSCRAFSLEIALCRLWQGQCSHENCADSRAYQDNAQ